MTTLTSTELGATGRFIRFTSAAFNNLGSQTIMSRCRPTGSGGGTFGYIYGKVASGTIAGPRFFLEHNSGNPLVTFGFSSSGVSGKPTRQATAGSITYNAWQDIAGTWDGSLISSGINLYVDGTAVNPAYAAGNNGSGSVSDDSANPVVLMNREGLGREFVGDVAWIAVWDRVLTTTEMNLARSDGPLEVPSGLVMLWANQEDLGPNSLTPTARSTYVAGALPPNTALGGTPAAEPVSFAGTVPAQSWVEDSAITPLDLSTYFSGDLTPFSYAVTTGTLPTGLSLNSSTGVISGTPTTPAAAVSIVVTATDDGSNPASTNAFNITITEAGVVPVLREDYERSSVNLSGSSVTGVGDDAVVTIKPRMQETEAVPTNPRWLEPSVRVDGVNGIRPSFKFIDYASSAGANKYHGAPWQSTRRPMFSYDRLTWHYFDTQTITASEIQFRHSTAFAGPTVYIGRSRQRSVEQVGDWLEAIAAAHPTKVAPTTSAAAFTPTLTSWPAQAFIADEFSAQTDELSRTVPATPFWAFEINDTALGASKRLAVMYSGVHAGEDHACYPFERAVEYLLGSSASAIALRTHYRIVVYPMLNAPGRAGGGWRGSFTQGTGGADDANRNFNAIKGLEIVSKPRAVLATDIDGVVPDWMIDWHGTYLNNYSVFINRANQTEFRNRVATASGFTVENEGTMASDSVENYFYTTLGTPFVATLEHGDKNPQTDANLVTWAEAVVDTLESMRADGYFYALPTTADIAAVGVSLASGTAGIVANVSISASGLAQAAGAAGLSADVLLAGSGAALASGNAALAAELSMLAAGAAEASGSAALTGGAGGDLSAVGGAVSGGSANLTLTVSLSGAGLAEALGAAALTGGAGGDLAGAGGAVAGGAGALVASVSVAASGSAVAGGVAVLDGGAAGDLAGSGAAVAGGSALVVATVALTAAGFVQAMGAGALAVQVPLSAAGGAVAGGAGGLLSSDVFVLVRDPVYWVADGRRFRVRAAWPRVG